LAIFGVYLCNVCFSEPVSAALQKQYPCRSVTTETNSPAVGETPFISPDFYFRYPHNYKFVGVMRDSASTDCSFQNTGYAGVYFAITTEFGQCERSQREGSIEAVTPKKFCKE
jgi:hypothetical protein